MGERMPGRETVTSTFPGRAGTTPTHPPLGWVTGLGHAISFKEILKGQSVSLGLLPSSSSGRREQGHAVFSWLPVSRDFLGTGRPDGCDCPSQERRGFGKPEREAIWGWYGRSSHRQADL